MQYPASLAYRMIHMADVIRHQRLFKAFQEKVERNVLLAIEID